MDTAPERKAQRAHRRRKRLDWQARSKRKMAAKKPPVELPVTRSVPFNILVKPIDPPPPSVERVAVATPDGEGRMMRLEYRYTKSTHTLTFALRTDKDWTPTALVGGQSIPDKIIGDSLWTIDLKLNFTREVLRATGLLLVHLAHLKKHGKDSAITYLHQMLKQIEILPGLVLDAESLFLQKCVCGCGKAVFGTIYNMHSPHRGISLFMRTSPTASAFLAPRSLDSIVTAALGASLAPPPILDFAVHAPGEVNRAGIPRARHHNSVLDTQSAAWIKPHDWHLVLFV